MDKAWGVLFLAAAVFSVAIFAVAPSHHWWFPEDVSRHGHTIDALFNLVLAVTGVAFIATQAILVYVVFRYSGRRRGEKAWFVHTHHGFEYASTALVSLILVIIAFVQINAWGDVKFQTRRPGVPTHARVVAGQFEWRVTYLGADKTVDTADDVHDLNQIHMPEATDVVIDLQSRDVLHSFFLPNFRIKQDAVPGMTIPVWWAARPDSDDDPTLGSWEIVCAELCGWGHYKMKGMVFVHPKATVDLTALGAEVAKLGEAVKAEKDREKHEKLEKQWAAKAKRLARLSEIPGLNLSYADWLTWKKQQEEATKLEE